MSYLKDSTYHWKVRSTYLPHTMTEPFYRSKCANNTWLGMRDPNPLLDVAGD
jgi:hypothetical protein